MTDRKGNIGRGHRRLVQDYWGSPTIAKMPGLKAVDLFRAVGDGRVKALWVVSTNPAVSWCESQAVGERWWPWPAWTMASHGRIGEAVNPALDPVSGQPEFKHTPVRLAPFAPPFRRAPIADLASLNSTAFSKKPSCSRA